MAYNDFYITIHIVSENIIRGSRTILSCTRPSVERTKKREISLIQCMIYHIISILSNSNICNNFFLFLLLTPTYSIVWKSFIQVYANAMLLPYFFSSNRNSSLVEQKYLTNSHVVTILF